MATVPTSANSVASRSPEMYQRYSAEPNNPLCPRRRPSGNPRMSMPAAGLTRFSREARIGSR